MKSCRVDWLNQQIRISRTTCTSTDNPKGVVPRLQFLLRQLLSA